MDAVLSKCWTFFGRAVRVGAPFSFRGKCTYCEWDAYEGMVLGYIQFEKPTAALSFDYPLGWKPTCVRFMNPQHFPMMFSFGTPVRPQVFTHVESRIDRERFRYCQIQLIKQAARYYHTRPLPPRVPGTLPVVTPETSLEVSLFT